MQAIVEATDGPGKGTKFPVKLNQVIVVGRTEWSDVSIGADAQLSSQHFKLELTGAGVKLQDMNSTNGTQVNGQFVKESPINPGDQIVAGTTTFQVRLEQPNAPAQVPVSSESPIAADSPTVEENISNLAGGQAGGLPPGHSPIAMPAGMEPGIPTPPPSSPIGSSPIAGGAGPDSPIQASPIQASPIQGSPVPPPGPSQPPTPSVPPSDSPISSPIAGGGQSPIGGQSPPSPIATPAEAKPIPTPPPASGSPPPVEAPTAPVAPPPASAPGSSAPQAASPADAPVLDTARNIKPASALALQYSVVECKSAFIQCCRANYQGQEVEFLPSSLVSQLKQQMPMVVVAHFQKAGMEYPKELTESVPVFSWLPDETARSFGPVIIPPGMDYDLMGALDQLWGHDAAMCFFAKDVPGTVDHLQQLVHYNMSGEKDEESLFGYCWPSVMNNLLEVRERELVEAIWGGKLGCVLMEVPDLQGGWQLFGDPAYQQTLNQLGCTEIAVEAEAEA